MPEFCKDFRRIDSLAACEGVEFQCAIHGAGLEVSKGKNPLPCGIESHHQDF